MIVETRTYKNITYRKHKNSHGEIFYTKEIKIDKEEYREQVRVIEKKYKINRQMQKNY